MHENQYPATLMTRQPDGKNTGWPVVEATIEDAEDGFVDAKERMLDVNNWNRYCPLDGVSFSLSDSHSRPVHRKAHGGDYIQIVVPGASPARMIIGGIVYDDYPDEGMETFTMILQPCEPLSDEEDKAEEGVMITERRDKHLYSIFYTRKVNSHAHTTDGFCGLPDEDWERLTREFVV